MLGSCPRWLKADQRIVEAKLAQGSVSDPAVSTVCWFSGDALGVGVVAGLDLEDAVACGWRRL